MSRKNAQRGQALSEFLVAATAVVPLLLLIPLVAKYQDAANSTQLASRYAAFEATLRNDGANTFKPQAQLQQEVARRFFSNVDAPIKTHDAAGDFKAHQNLFWRVPRDGALIRSMDGDIQLRFGDGSGTTHASAFTGAADGTPFALHQQLGLRARGIYGAHVHVRLANLPGGLKFFEPFDAIDLSITRGTSLLPDPWTAKEPQDVESRIAGSPAIFPAGSLAAAASTADAAVRIVELPGGIQGPKLGRLDFWRDVVPEDRLREAD